MAGTHPTCDVWHEPPLQSSGYRSLLVAPVGTSDFLIDEEWLEFHRYEIDRPSDKDRRKCHV